MTVMESQREANVAHLETSRPYQVVRLTVSGELDLASADDFTTEARSAIAGKVGTTLVIDMSAVSFIDATAIGALVAIRNDANRSDNTVVVDSPSRCVLRILELTALTQVFTTETQCQK